MTEEGRVGRFTGMCRMGTSIGPKSVTFCVLQGGSLRGGERPPGWCLGHCWRPPSARLSGKPGPARYSVLVSRRPRPCDPAGGGTGHDQTRKGVHDRDGQLLRRTAQLPPAPYACHLRVLPDRPRSASKCVESVPQIWDLPSEIIGSAGLASCIEPSKGSWSTFEPTQG